MEFFKKNYYKTFQDPKIYNFNNKKIFILFITMEVNSKTDFVKFTEKDSNQVKIRNKKDSYDLYTI